MKDYLMVTVVLLAQNEIYLEQKMYNRDKRCVTDYVVLVHFDDYLWNIKCGLHPEIYASFFSLTGSPGP